MRYLVRSNPTILSLTSSQQIGNVRRNGRAFPNHYLVTLTVPNAQDNSRIAVVAGKRVGNAVRRNRAKRMIREIIRSQAQQIPAGMDMMIIARQPIADATFKQLSTAFEKTLKRLNKAVTAA